MTARKALEDALFGCTFAAGQYPGAPYGEGHRAAQETLTVLATTAAPGDRQALLAEALADLIEVGLSWNNLHATQERLRGFAGVLAQHLPADTEPQPSLAGASRRPVMLTSLRA